MNLDCPTQFSLPLARPPTWQREQRRLLELCETKSLDLTQKLSEVGHTREDLRYEIDTKPLRSRSPVPLLEDFSRRQHGVPVVSFFSGCGGMDLGFEAAGFAHAALVEHNALFADTIRHNHPQWKVIGPPEFSGDVSKREELRDVLKKSGIAVNFPGVFVGGPPCQPFSIAANQRFSKNGENFKRTGFQHEKNGNLLFDYLWFIEQFRPQAFLIENVEGLNDVDGGEQLDVAIKQLSSWGYTVAKPLVLNAADFQVPQYRYRLFVCGALGGKVFTPPTAKVPHVPCGSVISRSLARVKNHEPREHKPESLLRYMILDYGQRDHLGRVDRLDPLRPSKTVIAGGTKGGGRSHLHPQIPRTLTVRECARLQTFPDTYEFLGPSARQFTQVGNAVPPILAAQLAGAIYQSFFKGRKP